MIMKHWTLLCLFFLIHLLIKSQSIIKNGGFESGNYILSQSLYPGTNYIYGSSDRFLDGIENWEGRFKRRRPNSTHNIKWHSPDWYGIVNSQPYLHSEFNYYIYPTNGNKYVGMMDYELIQQKLGTNNELENGIRIF